jgi:hypothetical protein
MPFKFCELSAAIGYATCYYENQDCDLSEALVVSIQEFVPMPNIDDATMAELMGHLDIATKEYQAARELDEDEDEDDDQDEDEDEDED